MKTLISQIGKSHSKIQTHIGFEDFEKAVMHKIIEKETPINLVLREQYKNAEIVDRFFSGAGFFTSFTVSQNTPLITEPVAYAYGDVEATINGNDGYGFILFIKNGTMVCLEGYTWRQEWPTEINSFSLVHSPSEK